MVRKTKEEAEATRNRLLDAAECVFERRGVSRTSLQEIAESAGLTRGAIYWHFKDKADLFDAIMSRVILPMEEALERSVDPGTDPLARLRANVLETLRTVTRDPQVRRVFEIATHKLEYVDEMESVRERHMARRDDCLRQFEKAMQAAKAEGRVGPQVSTPTAALGLHAMMKGLLHNWMLAPGAFDLVRVGTQVIDAYLAGLSPREAPAALPAAPQRRARVAMKAGV